MASIIKTSVNWFHGYANSPTLEVYVDDEMPPQSEYVYSIDRNDSGGGMLISTNKHPWVRFVYIDNPTFDPIRGGALSGEYKLEGGSILRTRSGWSSRAGVLNRDYNTRIIEVTVITPGGTRWAGYALDVDWLLENVELPEGVYLVREARFNEEPYWIPSVDPNEVKKP